MQIQYLGGPSTAIIRDIKDPRYNAWVHGEIKEVPDQDIDVLPAYGGSARGNAIRAVLNAGFRFTDVATGKNPLFTCVGCGEKADNDFFVPNEHIVEYKNPDGDPLCVQCFLADHPEHLEYHVRRGYPVGLQNLVHERVAKKPAVAAPVTPAIPAAPVVTPQPVSQAPADTEEGH